MINANAFLIVKNCNQGDAAFPISDIKHIRELVGGKSEITFRDGEIIANPESFQEVMKRIRDAQLPLVAECEQRKQERWKNKESVTTRSGKVYPSTQQMGHVGEYPATEEVE